jgi:hypothetical protein
MSITTQSLFNFDEENKTEHIDRLFKWHDFDNRLLCICKNENMVGDEVSCFTELNEDMTIKYKFHDAYECMMKVTRHLSMENVTEVQV